MNNGFSPIRNAVQEHLEKGRLTYFDFGIYVKIHLGADYKTGVWWGSAKKLLTEGPADGSLRRIQESLRRLAAIVFIKPFRVKGRRGNYAVLINKFDLRGELKGYRVNAEKTTDWRHPVLEPRTDTLTDTLTDVCTESGANPPQSASSNPLRSKKKEVRSTPVQENFKLFWKEYPRKAAQPAARRAWGKIKPSEVQAVMAGLERWKRSEQWNRAGVKFVPHPTTFLNQRRWEDMPEELQRQEAERSEGREMVKL